MCYGIKDCNKYNVEHLRRTLLSYNTNILENDHDCYKLYTNECQCGVEIKLSDIFEHYYDKEHKYNDETEYYLRHKRNKKRFTCNICTKNAENPQVYFKENDYTKVFEHMYKVHKMIMFPSLAEYNTSNKKATIIQNCRTNRYCDVSIIFL